MKKKHSVCDYTSSRNENLRREFLARLGRNGKSVTEVIESLTGIGAPRFYISEERALSILKNERAPLLGTRRLMMAEIKRRVRTLRIANPSMSMKDAVFQVVNSPAPNFYLTFSSIKTILYRS